MWLDIEPDDAKAISAIPELLKVYKAAVDLLAEIKSQQILSNPSLKEYRFTDRERKL